MNQTEKNKAKGTNQRVINKNKQGNKQNNKNKKLQQKGIK